MPAVVALPDIIIGLAGLLLLFLAYSLYVLRDVLVRGFSHIPGAGGWIGSHLAGWLDSAAHAVAHASQDAFDGARQIFMSVETWTVNVLHEITAMADEIGGTMWHIAVVQIPRYARIAAADTERALHIAGHAIDSAYHVVVREIDHATAVARHDTAAAFDAARHDIAHWYDTARHQTARDFAVTEHNIARLYDVTRHDIASAYDQALARADVLARQSEALSRHLFRQAEYDARRWVSTAETASTAALDAAIGGLVTDLDSWGREAVDRAWPDAERSLEALRKALGSAWPDLHKILPALGGLGAAGLLGALIRSLAGVNAVTTVMSECVIPNCDNLGQLGKDLSQLASALSAAAMLAWLVFMAADPVAAAGDTVRVASPLADAVFTPLVDLISAGTRG